MAQKEKNKGQLVFLLGGFVLMILSVCLPANKVFASGNTTGSAWSSQIGWVNFGCVNCNVQVNSTYTTGYAWSSNYGWINLGPLANGGVQNDGSGNLSGYAWGDKLGWINFSGVTINSSGHFIGTATGSITGPINFSCTNCDVLTTWLPPSGSGGSISYWTCDSATGTCSQNSSNPLDFADQSACKASCTVACGPSGDFNKDYCMDGTTPRVDGGDFSMMLWSWNATPASTHWNTCVNLFNNKTVDPKDPIIDVYDFSVFLYYWHPCPH